MSYPRKIDIERAVKLRFQGVKLEAIAAEFGVSRQAVHEVTSKWLGKVPRSTADMLRNLTLETRK